jgi:Domain of unknown function (DUF4105)
VIRNLLRFICGAVVSLVYLIGGFWAAGALYFDLPLPGWTRDLVAVIWVLAAFALPILLRPRWHGILIAVGAFALIVTLWLTIAPRQDRDWKPEVAILAHADVNGDRVTMHDIRNFDYRSETDFTPRYYTRTYDLRKLRGLDLFLNYWGSTLMAHPILSFDFGEDGRVAFSIETRAEKGEGFSALGGLYRRFELIYIPGDERDLVRVRTNFRKGEDVYLYKLNTTPERARERFLEYLAQLNELYAHPRWYNAVTTNCTTSIRSQHAAKERAPWDWRMLANGKADEMLYEQGILDRSLPFAELKRRAAINERALATTDAFDFSDQIRIGIPGY